MNTKVIAICAICAIIVIAGCIKQDDTFTPTPTPTLTPTPTPTFTPIPTPTLAKIDLLFNDIIENNIANKNHYSIVGGSKDVHICGNMACEQAEWIRDNDNYEYGVGVVALWNKCIGDNHAQTWVVIDNERYIIESISNRYWTEADHRAEFKNRYKITFVSISKGREHTKSSAEIIREG